MDTSREQDAHDHQGGDGDEQIMVPAVRSNAVGPVQMYDPYGEAEEQGREFSIRGILYMLFLHKWKILICFVVFSTLSVLYVTHVPHSYVSQAFVLIRSQRSSLIVEPGESGTRLKATPEHNQMRTEMAFLKSQEIGREVVKRVGLKYILTRSTPQPRGNSTTGDAGTRNAVSAGRQPNVLAKAVNWAFGLQASTLEKLNLTHPTIRPEDIAVKLVLVPLSAKPTSGGSAVLRLQYASDSPRKAQRILDTIVDVYQEKHIEYYSSQVSPGFFGNMAQEWRKQLEEKEKELIILQQTLNITSVEVQKELSLGQLRDLQGDLRTLNVEMAASRARIKALNNISTYGDKEGSDAPTVNSAPSPMQMRMSEQLVNLQLEESTLVVKYQDNHPKLKDLRAQIQELENIIAAQKSDPLPAMAAGVDPVFLELSMELATAEAELEAQTISQRAFEANIREVGRQLDTLLGNEKKINRLEDEITALEESHRQYLSSQQIAEMSATLDKDRVSNLRLVQPASLPLRSEKKARKMLALLLFGSFMGLMVGVGMALALEFLDQSIKTDEDVTEQLGLPVLIAMPRRRRLQAESVTLSEPF